MPPAKTPAEDFIEALRTAEKPFLDAKEWAEEVGVSAQTVRTRREELESHSGVKSAEVGQAMVWWYESDGDREEPNKDTQEVRDGDGQDLNTKVGSNPPRADGGYKILLSDHPWLEPVITALDISLFMSIVFSLSLGVTAFLAPYLLPVNNVVPALSVLAGLTITFLLICLVLLAVLEIIMYPHEAPIRRYFNQKPDARGGVKS